MDESTSKEATMRQIFETAQQMKNGKIQSSKNYASIKDFIADAKKHNS